MHNHTRNTAIEIRNKLAGDAFSKEQLRSKQHTQIKEFKHCLRVPHGLPNVIGRPSTTLFHRRVPEVLRAFACSALLAGNMHELSLHELLQ